MGNQHTFFQRCINRELLGKLTSDRSVSSVFVTLPSLYLYHGSTKPYLEILSTSIFAFPAQILSLLLTVLFSNRCICSRCFPQLNCNLLQHHLIVIYIPQQKSSVAQSEQKDKNPCLCGGGENRPGIERSFPIKQKFCGRGAR